MDALDTIVVPLDGSDAALRAVPVARAIAQRCGAGVLLMTSRARGGGASDADLDLAQDRLHDLPIDRIVLDDVGPGEAAIDLALAAPGRLLCMSTHGRGGLRRAALGSVADNVIRSGLVDVLVVGPACDLGAALDARGPLLLCVDGSDRSMSVVEAGRTWAALLARDLQLVTATNPFDAATPAELDARFSELSRPLASAGLRSGGVWIVNSSITAGLTDEAKRLGSPLMVVAPGSRSTWERLLVGSATLSILASAPCPVLVVAEGPKPPRSVEGVS